MTGLLLLFVPMIAIPALSIAMILRRKREVTLLAERGRVGHGRVVGHVRHAYRGRPGGVRRIELAHDEAGGRRRRLSVTRRQWDALTEGSDVDVVYLPDNPDVFATVDVVNRVRQTKGLSPLAPRS